MVTTASSPSPAGNRWQRLLPGLALGGAVTAAAFLLRSLELPGLTRLSPLMLAIMIGMLVRNTLGRPEAARAGLAFSLRGPLRLGIILLGLQVTLAEILGIGWSGLLILAFALLSTYLFTLWLGGRLGVAPGLATLIAAGTGVCGASAIVAANTVVRDGDESVAYALATVTLFGTIAMFSYPLIGAALHLPTEVYGLWSGASVHEVAQVVAAGFARGQAEGEFATVAKLARVLMLAPLVIGMGLWAARQTQGGSRTGSPPIPWFVFGFLALVLLGARMEEMMKPGLEQIGHAGVTGDVPAQLAIGLVGAHHHGQRVPTHDGHQPLFGGQVAWKHRLLVDGDGVHVRRVQLGLPARALLPRHDGQLVQNLAGPLWALRADQRQQSLAPFGGLFGVDVASVHQGAEQRFERCVHALHFTEGGGAYAAYLHPSDLHLKHNMLKI